MDTPISASSGFRGFLFKFSNDRFLPDTYGFGQGYCSYATLPPSTPANTWADSPVKSIPITSEVFKFDTDFILSTSSPIVPILTGNNFWLRLRTHKYNSNFGEEILTGGLLLSPTYFKGTIVYKSGDIISTPTPTPPVYPGDVPAS